MSRRRLGRGLDGLLPAVPAQSTATVSQTAPIEELHPNRDQPRQQFAAEALAELATSIKEHGVLEPILVRRRKGGGYEIIAGERRWRAAQQAGLKEVPIFTHDLSDAEAFEAALVENLQREDLNPVEMARAFERLSQDYDYTQEQIAARVGKDRSTVANALRLLKLPEPVLAMLRTGDLSEGHGRALLSCNNVATINRLAALAARESWSVRQTERRARQSNRDTGPGATGATNGAEAKSANVRHLERRLSHALGSPVTVKSSSSGKGQLVIRYASLDELDRLITKLS